MNQVLVNKQPLTVSKDSLRILLAEADGDLRRLLALVLGRDGHDVIQVRDGGALLEALASGPVDRGAPQFDLVISEQRLPGIQGMTVLAGLRARDNEIHFVLICGDPPTQQQARDLGGVVVDSPFDVEAIRGAVRMAGAR